MQSVYQINVIPAHKPWRGYGAYYVKDKEVFDLFSDEMWLPEASYDELPDKFKYLAVEPQWDYEAEITKPYTPNGTENWETMTYIDEYGDEVELEASMTYILDNAMVSVSQNPFEPVILLGSVTVFTE